MCACMVNASLTEGERRRERERERDRRQVVLHAEMKRQKLPMGIGARNQAAGRGSLAVKNAQNAPRSNCAICATLCAFLCDKKGVLLEIVLTGRSRKGKVVEKKGVFLSLCLILGDV